MTRMTQRRSTWLVATTLALSAAACQGCPGRRPAEAPAAAAGTRLGALPAGHELGEARFRDDGKLVAFVATKDGQAWVHAGAERFGPYLGARGLEFHGPERTLAFVARREDGEALVVGGVEGTRFGEIGTVRPGAAGAPPVYSASRDQAWRVVAGAHEVPVQGTADPGPVVSADGKRVAWVEPLGAGGLVAVRACAVDLTGCAAGTPYEAIAWSHPAAGGSVVAAVASREGRDAVVTVDLSAPGVAERASGWFDAVALVAVSRDGRHLAFLARRGERHLLVKDGAELGLPRLDSPLELQVGDDGRALLTGITQEGVVVLLDGKQIGKAYEGAYFPLLAPAGGVTFLAEREGRNVLVVDGEEGPTWDKAVGPAFTPDGSRLVYRARQDGQRFVVVADRRGKTLRELPRAEAVFEFVLAPDGRSVGYGVQVGREFSWRVEPL